MTLWRTLVLFAVAVLPAACAGDDDTAGVSSPGSTIAVTVATVAPASSIPQDTMTAAPVTTAPPDTTVATDPSIPAPVDPGDEVAVPPTGETVEGRIVLAEGRMRTYRVYVPAERDPGAPLLLALHGGSGSGQQFERTSGFDAIAAEQGFLVVYPDGTPTALGPDRLAWNAGGCCAAPARNDVDDVAFLDQLIDTVASKHAIDPTNVAVTGHSNGAMMALRLACEAADHVRAVAVQAGTVFIDDCAPTRSVSVLDLHGSVDRNLPVDGGVGPESAVGVDFPPVRDGLAVFAAAAGCGAITPVPQPTATANVTLEAWSGCPDGVAIELAIVDGAPHIWMRTPVDAPAFLWSFLATHT